MKIRTLITRLERIAADEGDIDVHVHAVEEGDPLRPDLQPSQEAQGPITVINVEQDHNTELMFVRISGGNE